MGCFHRRGNGFLDTLKEMPRLTKLGLPVAKDEDFEAIAVSMPSLTGLRSLNLSGSRFLVASPENEEGLFASLTQLTHLSLWYHSTTSYRHFPTGIRSLGVRLCKTLQEDVAEILMCMPNLTSLSIDIVSDCPYLIDLHGVTLSLFSQELKKLKRVSLESVVVDDAFLDALGGLTQLTSLTLASRRNFVDPYVACPRLSKLTKLMQLTISPPMPTPVRNDEFPQLCFPKPSELDLPLSGVDDTMHQALLKTLPFLRKVSLSGQTLIFE